MSNNYKNESVLFEKIQTENGKFLGVATLNSPETLNALTLEMVRLLTQKLMEWKDDSKVSVIILQSEGDRAFSAGGDLQSLYHAMQESSSSSSIKNQYITNFFEEEYRLDYIIHTYPKPILSWGHGIIMGGGMGIFMGASHRVVTETARVAMPEVAIGLYPDVGGSWFLNRTPRFCGLFIALTGISINANDAIFAKFADYKVNNSQKSSIIEHLIKTNWTGDRDHELLTDVMLMAENKSSDSFKDLPNPLYSNYNLIQSLCQAPNLDKIVHNILSLQTEDKWLQKGQEALSKGSPTSIHLIYEIQRKARFLSLAEVFRLEYTVTLQCCSQGDFKEGIRALIIEKDKKPNWNPISLDKINTIDVMHFFNDPWGKEKHPLADLK